MVTTVTGPVGATYDAVFAGLTATLVRTGGVVGYDGGAIAPDQKTYVTDGVGILTMADLKPGKYELTLSVPINDGVSQTILWKAVGTVASDAGANITLEAFLDKNIGTITPSFLQQAIAAKDAAEAAAILAQSAYQGRQYTTRAEFVADAAYVNGADAPVDGTVVTAGGVQYVRSTGATVLPGLPGWLPFKSFAQAHPAGDLRAWGAVPVEADPTADASDALEACMAANPNGQHIVNGGGGTYRATRQINVTRGNIELQEFTIDGTANAAGAPTGIKNTLVFSGSEGAPVALTTNAVRGQTVITVASTASFAEKQYCLIESDLIVSTLEGGTAGQMVQIKKVLSGTQVRLYQPLEYAFAIANDARLTPCYMLHDVNFNGLRMRGAAGVISTQQGVFFEYVTHARFNRFISEDFDYTHLGMHFCNHFDFDSPQMYRAINTGNGYGLRAGRMCHLITATEPYAKDVRRIFDIGGARGVSRMIRVINPWGEQIRADPFGAHGMCDQFMVRGGQCSADPNDTGNGYALQFRGMRMQAEGLQLNGFAHAAFRHNPIGTYIPAECIVKNVQFGNAGLGSSIVERAFEIGLGNENADFSLVHIDTAVTDSVIPPTPEGVEEGEMNSLIRLSGPHYFDKVSISNVTGSSPIASSALFVDTRLVRGIGEINVNGLTAEITTSAAPIRVFNPNEEEKVDLMRVDNCTFDGGSRFLNLSGVAGLRVGQGNTLENYAIPYLFANVGNGSGIFVPQGNEVPSTGAAEFTVLPQHSDIAFSSNDAQTVTLPDAAQYPNRVIRLRKRGTGSVVSASANVIGMDSTTTPTTTLMPDSGVAWVVLRATGANWRMMAAG